jgi:hypothetical protein
MAVVSVKVKGQRTFSYDDKPTGKARRVYQVRCDDRNDGADVACLACPVVGEPFSAAYPTMLVRTVSADEAERTGDGGVMYDVTVDYSTESGNANGGDPEDKDPDPCLRPGTVRLSYATSEETFWQIAKGQIPTAEDSDGAPVTIGTGTWKWGNTVANSAGTAFKDGLKETVYDAVYTVEKNIEMTDWVTISDTLDEYAGAVCSDDFTIKFRGVSKKFKKKTVLLTSPSSEPGYENGKQFMRVSIQLCVRADGWEHKVLDQGLRSWSGTPTTGKQPDVKARDIAGDETTEPMFLDGKGKKLGEGAKPVFLKFPRRKGTKPFSRLGLARFE